MKLKKQYRSFTILEGLLSLLFVSLLITYVISFLFTILGYYLFTKKKAYLLFTQQNFISCYHHYHCKNCSIHAKEMACFNIINRNHHKCTGYKLDPQLLNGELSSNKFKLICYEQEKIIILNTMQ